MPAQEGLVLDGLDLNNPTGDFLLLSLDLAPPAKKPEWVTGADADGAALVRDPLFDNRTIKAQIRVASQVSMDVALSKVGQLVDKLEEAERQPDGLALTWTPSTGSKSITFYVLSGAIDGMPISRLRESGWFRYRPTLDVTLICKPFGYGTAVAGPSVTSSDPIVQLLAGGYMNMITNPSFETNTTGWALTAGSLTRDATSAFYGGVGARVQATLAASGYSDSLLNIGFSVVANQFAVQAGQTWTFSCYFKGTQTGAAVAWSIFIYWYDANGVQVGAAGVGLTVDGKWRRVSTTGTAPTGAVKAALWIGPTTGSASSQTIDYSVDGAMFTQTAAATRYFDGSQAGAIWNGTAHASTSQTAYDQINSVTNPSFETDLNGSVGGGGTNTRSSTWAKAGSWSLRCTRSNSGPSYAENGAYFPSNGVAGGFPAVGGNTYTASAWVNVLANTGIGGPVIYIRFADGASVLSQPSVTGLNALGEQRITVTGTAPVGTTNAFVIVLLAGTSAAYTSDGFIDAVQFEEAASASTYFDGDSAQSAWGGTAHASASVRATGVAPQVAGDVPAEGRLVVTDMASKTRRHLEWGLQQRYYNAATSLIVDSDDMITSGYAGSQTTRTGAYDPNAAGNNVIRASLFKNAIAVCGTGNLAHVGTFRVKARVYATATGVYLRLNWQEGDGPFRTNPYVTPPVANAFTEVDLGLITIPEKKLGTQRWSARIEAYGADNTTTLDIDALWLIPAAEGYGLARSDFQFTLGSTISAYDDFTGTTAGNALNGRTAPLGGSWVTSGAANDFTFYDDPNGGEGIQRTGTGDASSNGRFAALGATSYTDIQVSGGIYFNPSISVTSAQLGVLGRFVDTNNYVGAYVSTSNTGLGRSFAIEQRVAGTWTALAAHQGGIAQGVRYTINIAVLAAGTVVAQLVDYVSGAVISELSTSSVDCATGGALASGKPGFRDYNNGPAFARLYDDLYVYAPSSEPIVCYSGQAIQIRSDDPLRADSTGTYWGVPPTYRGSRFLLPPAGDKNRTSRILVKMRRNDVAVAADDQIADSTKVEVFYTPRYVAVAR